MIELLGYNGPLILNMDLLPGPANGNRLNKDQIELFIEQVNRFPNAIISPSWFTHNHTSQIYTAERRVVLLT